MARDSFVWHDYETFGADPRRDRPCQFAALRTDTELQPIGDPVVWYCQPTLDLLPSPDACLITGITPQYALRHGESEYRFAERIHDLLSQPGTCGVGYNSFRFDDEVTRFLFWRNFIDPYAREFRNGNSRFDLIDVLRMTRALRPEGIEWPDRDEGTPSFRLEDLARANGLSTENAHDALADVENTLAMARLLRRHQPRLWDWALHLRTKHAVERLLEPRTILLHVSARLPAAQGCIAPVLPLARHPRIASQWLVWNLREDPTAFLDFDAETLADLYWTPAADLPEDLKRLPVKWVRTNRCPMLSPVNTLDEAARERSGIDLGQAERHATRLASADEFIARLIEAMAGSPPDTASDAEVALYQGFVGNADRGLAERARGMTPDQLADWLNDGAGPFDDSRLNDLLLRFVGRFAPERLNDEARAEWEDYRRRRLLDDPDLGSIRLAEYRARLAELRLERSDQNALLDALEAWPGELGLSQV